MPQWGDPEHPDSTRTPVAPAHTRAADNSTRGRSVPRQPSAEEHLSRRDGQADAHSPTPVRASTRSYSPSTVDRCQRSRDTVEDVSRRAIAFFDVDGTLAPHVSTAQYLASYLGHLDDVARAEAAWDAGLMPARAVEELDARGWRGTSEAQIRSWLADLPLIDGIPDVLAWCAASDVLPVLATLAWRPVGEYLCETFGFAGCCGPTLEVADGCYTGRSLASCDEYAKLEFARRIASQAGLSLDGCIAVGDSRSDLPLFGEVGLAVALNADAVARAAASAVVDAADLRAIIPLLADWLAR